MAMSPVYVFPNILLSKLGKEPFMPCLWFFGKEGYIKIVNVGQAIREILYLK
jgi:hypothetical protein